MGRMRSAGFPFSFLFLFSLPFLRIVGKKRSRGGYESKKQNIMNLGLGKQAIDFCADLFQKGIYALRSSLSLCTIPTTILPCPKIPIPSQFPIFFPLFLFPRISTDTLVLIPTYLQYLAR